MAKTLDELIAESKNVLKQVSDNTDLDNSIITLLNAQSAQLLDLKAQLAAAGTDAIKLQELSDTIDVLAAKAIDEGKLTASAITNNTPAANPPAAPVEAAPEAPAA